MRIFICYASEQRPVADKIALALRNRGHTVFFDRDALPAGDEYNARIRSEIRRTHLMIFLISPESLSANRYTLSELDIARKAWKRPAGRLLPVLIKPAAMANLPAMLTSVSVLEPQGDVTADVLAAVESVGKRRQKTRLRYAVALAAVVIAAIALATLTRDYWWPNTGGADTMIAGKLRDPISGSGIEGADVEIEYHGRKLTHVASDEQGHFRLSFPLPRTPDAQNVTLAVSHDRFVGWSGIFPIEDGQLTGPPIEIELTPIELSACRPDHDPLVVVGHFLASAGVAPGQNEDLPFKVSAALMHKLLPAVQLHRLPSSLEPIFLACGEAKPRSMQFVDNYAKSLRADVFVTGQVRSVDGAYDVTMALGDRFSYLSGSGSYVNRGVDLDDAEAAEMDSLTYAAILAVLAKGYAERSLYDECVLVAKAAGDLIDPLTPELDALRTECQSRTGMGQLAGGAP